MAFNISPEARKEYLMLLVVFVFSLSLRIWLLDKRWVNPDEGAHLMDAVLVLDGKIPSVDFISRQPIYVFANAAVFKLLGVSYISGRLIPITCSILVGFIVFLMSNSFYDRKVAILSASIYWMLPLELLNSVVVKTEPLNILLTCLSLYAVILFSQSDRTVWLIIAGIFAAMGFYVRQSALIIPLTIFGFLLIYQKGRIREAIKCFGLFLIGYASVVFLALIYFTRFMGFEEFLIGSLSPIGFIAKAGKNLPSLIGKHFNSGSDVVSQAAAVSQDQYKLYSKYVHQSIRLHSFFIIGFGFSIITLFHHFISRNNLRVQKHLNSYSLLYLWIFTLFIAYTYFYFYRSFYIDYCREFLPPLAIIFSAWLCSSSPTFEKDEGLGRLIVGGLLLYVVIFVAGWYFKKNLEGSIIACFSLALFTLFYFVGKFKSKTRRLIFLSSLAALGIIIVLLRQAPLESYLSGKIPKLVIIGIIFALPLALLAKKDLLTSKEYVRFASYFVALGAFVLSLTYSADRLTLAYDSNWSPSALEKTSAYLKNHTIPTDSVMSGAVIWELQAMRKPFMGISHPLGFEHRISKEKRESIETAIRTKPPEVIILDGFTEKTYFRQIPWLWDFLNSMYNLVHTAEPARKPVKIYKQKNKLEASPQL